MKELAFAYLVATVGITILCYRALPGTSRVAAHLALPITLTGIALASWVLA